jgi:hypothetical protein
MRLTSSRSLPENPLANDFAIALPETAASACPGGGGATSRARERSRCSSSGASGNHNDGQYTPRNRGLPGTPGLDWMRLNIPL